MSATIPFKRLILRAEDVALQQVVSIRVRNSTNVRFIWPVFLYTSDERSSDSPGLTEFNRPLKTEEVNPSQIVLPDFLAILGHEIVCRRHLQNPPAKV